MLASLFSSKDKGRLSGYSSSLAVSGLWRPELESLQSASTKELAAEPRIDWITFGPKPSWRDWLFRPLVYRMKRILANHNSQVWFVSSNSLRKDNGGIRSCSSVPALEEKCQ